MRKWRFFVIVVALAIFVMRSVFSPVERSAMYAGQPVINRKPEIANWNMYAGITVYVLVMALLATDKENLQWFSKRNVENK